MTIMEEITFEDYKSAIKKEYEVAKENDILGYLSDLTPAQVRDLCISISNKSLNNNDEIILRAYFGAKENEDLKKVIEKFGTGKFKSVISFLKNRKDSNHRNRIELSAILVDFKPRPFNNYRRNSLAEVQIDEEIEIVKEETTNLNESAKKEIENTIPSQLINSIKKESWIQRNKLKVGTFLIIIFSGFMTTQVLFSKKDCMQWNKDHYEAVDCNVASNQKIDTFYNSQVIKKNQDLIDNFKKITITDTTPFFNKDGSPKVWYGKSFDGHHDCFTMPGLHPETGITLRKITQHIINKHLLKK